MTSIVWLIERTSASKEQSKKKNPSENERKMRWLMIGISIAFCLLCSTAQKLFVAHWSSGWAFVSLCLCVARRCSALLWRSSLWISSLSIFCGHTLHKAPPFHLAKKSIGSPSCHFRRDQLCIAAIKVVSL